MNAMGVRRTADQVLALAPDEASRRAGSRLGTAGPWSGTGRGDGAVWGLCEGSGGTPYRTVVDTTGPAYLCGCPSRKFPCKHALGLLLLQASDETAIGDSAAPDWAERWLAARRGRAEGAARAAEGDAGGGPADPEAARRRAERRAARITSGAEELERRLADLLRGGLAAAEQPGYGLWEETAARMVDAQAPGLAGRVRELGAIPGSGPGWPVRLLEECALTHLLDRAWLTADRLPAPFATTVRTRVGLPAPVTGLPVRDHWLVLAQYDAADTRLTTRRIWLHGTMSGRTALLLSFGAGGRAPRLALPVGAVLDGELTPHTGSGQLRAEPGEQFVPVAGPAAPPPGGPVGAALDAYGRALGEDPWLESWPVTLSGVVPARAEYGWQLADADGPEALPLTPAGQSRPGLWRLVALSGGGPVTVFGECGHRGFSPLAAWSPESPEETVPLI
ncbi:SWIM zinc finger family protein [Streptomyces venezuelae]|uniref:SWIM zinc finger family protein n=1 Tax=Streptomyces venezuelae TaxID=54571 RepID=UPI00168D8C89|nr:SWIM zinc finger family protein [Streptomyces venezuelae]